MTLIVYKNRILAGDSRTSLNVSDPDKYVCGHCGEDHQPVRNNSEKLMVFRAGGPAMFRGQKARAVAIAGEVKKSHAARSLIRSGQDIEAAYKNFLTFVDPRSHQQSCTLLLVCEKNVFVLKMPHQGPMVVKEHGLDDFVTIGSGSHGADWINTIVAKSTATSIIVAVMAKEKSVGGDISYIDTSKEQLELCQSKQTINPKDFLQGIALIYEEGDKVIEERKQARIAKEKAETSKVDNEKPARPARKPPAKKAAAKPAAKAAVKARAAKPPAKTTTRTVVKK